MLQLQGPVLGPEGKEEQLRSPLPLLDFQGWFWGINLEWPPGLGCLDISEGIGTKRSLERNLTQGTTIYRLSRELKLQEV